MASSRRRPGKGIGEILADQQILRETGGLQSLFEPSDPGIETPIRNARDRGYSIFDPQQGPPSPTRRVKPGIGGPGRQRIQESLTGAPFTISSLPEEVEVGYDVDSEGEPPEPPSVDAEEDDSRKLPDPEYIGPISQSTKRPGYGAVRPDNDPAFYNGGPTSSTRVHGIQWIPVLRDDTYVVGDILVAFARPSSRQRASSSGSLYIYGGKQLEIWNSFKASMSLGHSVNVLLGTGVPFNTESIKFYQGLHPDYTGSWIFTEMGLWRKIREPNAIDGGTRTEGRVARETEAVSIVEELF